MTTTTLPRGHADAPAPHAAITVGARREWLVCMLLAALWFGVTAGLRPLAIPDEGRYVGVAWEMLRSGHWAVPTLDGMPFFHKPPLFYWITAASMEVFGVNVVAARAAPWLSAVATTTALFAFVKRWIGPRQARGCVVVLATLPLFYGGAQFANLDMLVAGCIALAILAAAHAVLAREAGRPHFAALAAAFACVGLGLLAKGLIGAVLPALVLAVWGVVTRRPGRVATLLLWAPGWLLCGAIAMPWFIAMQHRFDGFAHYFFVVQHVQRFLDTGFNNPQPFWFYPLILAATALPWLGCLRPGRRADAPPVGAERDLRLLMLAWLSVVTLFFSLPGSKLVGYILPALVPLAFLVAQATGRVSVTWRQRTAVGAAIGCAALAVVAHFGQPKSAQRLAAHLRESRLPGEPVVYLGQYDFDIAFYARLDTAPLVVDAWSPEELAKDSWRRALVDARGFAPPGVPSPLLHPAELGASLCETRGAWLVGAWPTVGGPKALAGLAPVYQANGTALWHLQTTTAAVRRALGCGDGDGVIVARRPAPTPDTPPTFIARR